MATPISSRPASALAATIAGAQRPAINAGADQLVLDPVYAAQTAHLHYVNDRMPGITRSRVREGFLYHAPDGRLIEDPEQLQRIQSLRIPPAWRDVWICPDQDGHIQAVGFDARGRKQYIYHAKWREVRDETKFEHMLTFGRALPHIRHRVEADLKRRGLPREKLVAAVVRLMERTLGRVGNPEYARENETFGLTTLRHDHVRITAGRIELDFSGKHHIEHHKVVSDPVLARILKNCQDLPGSELFQYIDEAGKLRHISSEHVNDYLRQASGHHIMAKDFRTWAATNLAVLEMAKLHERRATKKDTATVVKRVAAQLGNTPAVCRKSYIHPRVLASYLDGSLLPTLEMIEASVREPEMWAVEGVVMRLLAQWHPEGSKATEAADKAVRLALGE
ncbi:MAG TPA: DNA topoisomerase IB [Burkholderiaceae bacterium]|nr:DNA topoisomerase IB [Burkholderiaceae bacterium]